MYENNISNYYILKFSNLEYLEQIKKGHIYFKESKYFKNVEENHIGDSREGKIRVDSKSIPMIDNIYFQVMCKTEELNFYQIKEEKIPIFCCSIIDNLILNKIDNSHYDFKKEFINEMKKWGNSFILINLGEFLRKIDKECKKNNIHFYADKVKYDQEDRILTFDEAYVEFNSLPHLAFFHKTKKYKWQNEFRIVLYSNNKQIVSATEDSITLNIGELDDAVIYQYDDLSNIGVVITEKR